MTGIIKDANKSHTLKELRNEINILKDLEHDNIIKLYDWYLEQDSLAKKYIVLVMEYASGGDLGYLKAHHNNEIPLDISKKILEQILNGLDYLHTNNVIHRDLKLENILISDNNPIKIKIADFGLAKIYNNNTNLRHSILGTPGYIHENILTGAYGKYVDYRAFGSIMYLLLTKDNHHNLIYYNRGWKTKTSQQILQLISQTTELEPPQRFLLEHLFNRTIKNYSYTRIINHQFFKGLNITKPNQIAFRKPSEITYEQLYQRRPNNCNIYSKRSKNFNSRGYYNNQPQKLHLDTNCDDLSIESNRYVCRYCGYLICSKCTPRHKTILKRVKHGDIFTFFSTHNTDSRICHPCALYLGYIQRDVTGGKSLKKRLSNKNVSNKNIIYTGPKGGKYYFKKDKNNNKKKVYVKNN